MAAPTVVVTIDLSSMIGVAEEGVVITITMDRNDVYGGFVIATETTVTTGVGGIATPSLFPNALPSDELPGLGTTGSRYRFQAQTSGRKLDVEATIPNQAVNLHSVILSEDDDVGPGAIAGSIRYDVAQSLTSDQMTQARTNIGFTAAVLATVLTGFSTASASTVTAADTVLSALGKAQAQLTGKADLAGAAFTGVSSFTANSASPVLTLTQSGAGPVFQTNGGYTVFNDATGTNYVSLTPGVTATLNANAALSINTNGVQRGLWNAGGLSVTGAISSTGQHVSSATGGGTSAGFTVNSAAPYVGLSNSGSAVDNKTWDFGIDGAVLFGRAVNDANSAAVNWLEVTRSGTAISSIRFTGPTEVTSTLTATGSITSFGAAFVSNTGIEGDAAISISPSGSSYAEVQAYKHNIGYTAPLVLQRQGGNVVIGTATDAGTKLSVHTSGDEYAVTIGDAVGSNLKIAGTADAAYSLLQTFAGSVDGGRLVLQRDSGNVLIGTIADSGARLTVAGRIASIQSANGFNTGVQITGTGDSGGILALTGNGATTPSKYIRAYNGELQVLNNAVATAILTLTDAGALSATSNISVTGGAFAVGSLYASAGFGMVMAGRTGTDSDLTLVDPTGSKILLHSRAGTGGISLAGGIGAESLRALPVVNAVNCAEVEGSITGNPVKFGAAGSDGAIQLFLSSKGAEPVNIMTDNHNQRAARFLYNATAGDYLTVQPGAGTITLGTEGGSANRSINVVTGGTGAFSLLSNGGANTMAVFQHIASAVNYPVFSPAGSGGNILIEAAGTDADIDIELIPGGIGAVIVPDLRINKALTAETVVCTHTLTLNVNGTNYKFPCVAA